MSKKLILILALLLPRATLLPAAHYAHKDIITMLKKIVDENNVPAFCQAVDSVSTEHNLNKLKDEQGQNITDYVVTTKPHDMNKFISYLGSLDVAPSKPKRRKFPQNFNPPPTATNLFIQKILNDDLLDAAIEGNFTKIQHLSEQGADVNAKHTTDKPRLLELTIKTPLLAAIIREHEQAVTQLLRANADPTIPGEHKTTPLMHAAYLGKRNIVQALMAAGAPLKQIDDEGLTAYDYALRGRHCHLARELDIAWQKEGSYWDFSILECSANKTFTKADHN